MAESVLEHRMGANAAGAGQYAPVNGLNLYYERYGSGPPLVLIPGIQGRWEYLRPAIDALGVVLSFQAAFVVGRDAWVLRTGTAAR